jgi:hypothetical protein
MASIWPVRSRFRFLRENASEALSVIDPFDRPKARKDGLGVGPARHQLGADERAYLNVLEAGGRQGIDKGDLVCRGDRSLFDLKAFTRPFLADLDVLRQIAHGPFLLLFASDLSNEIAS